MNATTKELYEAAALHSAGKLYALVSSGQGLGFSDPPAEGANQGEAHCARAGE